MEKYCRSTVNKELKIVPNGVKAGPKHDTAYKIVGRWHACRS